LLLKKVEEGRLSRKAALRVIESARRQAEKVRDLLRLLGDTDEGTALANRFRRMVKRLERSDPDPELAEIHGRLSVAFHELNLILSKEFYPAASQP
jgi:hypothetical protein